MFRVASGDVQHTRPALERLDSTDRGTLHDRAHDGTPPVVDALERTPLHDGAHDFAPACPPSMPCVVGGADKGPVSLYEPTPEELAQPISCTGPAVQPITCAGPEVVATCDGFDRNRGGNGDDDLVATCDGFDPSRGTQGTTNDEPITAPAVKKPPVLHQTGRVPPEGVTNERPTYRPGDTVAIRPGQLLPKAPPGTGWEDTGSQLQSYPPQHLYVLRELREGPLPVHEPVRVPKEPSEVLRPKKPILRADDGGDRIEGRRPHQTDETFWSGPARYEPQVGDRWPVFGTRGDEPPKAPPGTRWREVPHDAIDQGQARPGDDNWIRAEYELVAVRRRPGEPQRGLRTA